ncbi:MAG TPA: hypothetical protein VFX48_01075, partial [Saprospiraceae bacterium]|nr:hypothetical protein [Saprospiraceae bacterium]
MATEKITRNVSGFVGMLLLSGILHGQDARFFAAKGDLHYRDSSYTEAEEAYRKAQDLKSDFKHQYNI